MKRICARAPGKLFLLGEYAVLDGAPAIVAAVDRYVSAELRPAAGERVSIASDQTTATVGFRAGDPPSRDDFFAAALSAYAACLAARPELAGCALDIRISSASSYVGGSKIGFGSSAAVTVALVAALMAAASGSSTSDRAQILKVALDAHRRLQRGVGSGADVAASVFGSLILFRGRPGQSPEISALPVPADLRLLAAWTGESASSVNLIGDYLALGNGNTAARREFVCASTDAVERFAASAQRGELSFEAIDSGARALAALAVHMPSPVLTPKLSELIARARANGAVAKASGAGGGDCGIAFARDATAVAAIGAAWRAAGLVPLDIAISPQGVSIELA